MAKPTEIARYLFKISLNASEHNHNENKQKKHLNARSEEGVSRMQFIQFKAK